MDEIRKVPTKPKGGGSAAKDWLRALERTAPIAASPERTLPRVIEELACKRAAAPALLSANESLTYGRLVERANRYARWALSAGLDKGDVVCLMMPNRPEYMAIWLGLSSVGVVVSLLNTQLRGHSLAHCVDIVSPRQVIVALDLFGEFRSATAELNGRWKIWSHGGTDSGDGEPTSVDRAVEPLSGEPLEFSERKSVTIEDRALLIYTSGTTGLPKAANVSHRRLLQWSYWFAGLMNTGPDDRMYDCLPMYHSVGGIVATGAVLVSGGSVLIREKFSTQQFWDDVVDWDCTLMQYIGEVCRYLVNAPKNPRERKHRIRICCGNGMQADVWRKFQKRFAIPRVLEFYAATEGNVSLYNVEGKVGAIGRIPSFLAHRFPLALVKCDPAAGEPVRDQNGFCLRCTKNDIGEAVGRIRNGSSHSGAEFEGYTNVSDSEQKILRDVFDRGDAWYRTGDLMRMDEHGYFYFVDRIGDTFRWKGENVATSEVAAAVAAYPGIAEATVYGVNVPGTEGAAGMATIVTADALDLVEFRQHLTRRLPAYARPLFLRVTDKIAKTATFKQAIKDLKREHYNPATTSDAIYFDDPEQGAFARLDIALYERIRARKIRV